MLLIAVGTLAINIGILVLPLLLPAIIEELAITPTQAGFAITVLTAISALCKYPGGKLTDQLSRKTMLVFSSVVVSLGFVILFSVTSYSMFLLGVAMVGVSFGVYIPASFVQLSDLFDVKQGAAFGINSSAANLGGIVASGVAIVVLALGQWRLAFAPLVVLFLILILLFHRELEDGYELSGVELNFRSTVVRILFTSEVRLALVVAGLSAFVLGGAINFFPIFLETDLGLASRTVTIAYASVFLAGVLITPFSGVVGDRFGNLNTVLVMLGVTIFGLGTVLTTGSSAGVLIGVVLFGAGITGFWPVMTSYLLSTFPENTKGGDFGAISALYMSFGSLGPTYVGAMSEQTSYTIAYVGLVALSSISLVLALLMRFRYQNRS